MEISTERPTVSAIVNGKSWKPDGRVYVRWHDGGPHTVLDRDQTVTTEVGMGGTEEWSPLLDLPEIDDRGDYDDGFSDGVFAGVETSEAAARLRSVPKASA